MVKDAVPLPQFIAVDFEARVAEDSPKLHSQVGGYQSSLIAFATKVVDIERTDRVARILRSNKTIKCFLIRIIINLLYGSVHRTIIQLVIK